MKKPTQKELNDLKGEAVELRKHYQVHERKDVDSIVRLLLSIESNISGGNLGGMKKAAAELKMIQALGELESAFIDPSKIGADPGKAAAVQAYCVEIASLARYLPPALKEKADGFASWVGTEYVGYSRKLDDWFVKNPKSSRANAEKFRKKGEDKKAKAAFSILYSSLKAEVISSTEMPAAELQRRMDRIYASAEATDTGLKDALGRLDFGDHLLNSSWLDLLKTGALLNMGIDIGKIGNEKLRGVYKTAWECEKNYKGFEQCYLEFKSALQGGDQSKIAESVGKLSQAYITLSYSQARLAVLAEDYDLKGFEHVMPALSKAMDVMMAVSLATGVGAVATLGRAGLKAALLETGEYMLEQGMKNSLKITFAFFVPEVASEIVSSNNLAEAEQIAQTNQLAGLQALSLVLQKARGARKGAQNAGGMDQLIADINSAARDLEAQLKSNPGYKFDPIELSKLFVISWGQMLLFEAGFGLMRGAKVISAKRAAANAEARVEAPAGKALETAKGETTKKRGSMPKADKLEPKPGLGKPLSKEFSQAKELADAKEATGDFAGSAMIWKDAALAAKKPSEAMEMCEMAEAAYRKAGDPLKAAQAYAEVAYDNPAVAEGNMLGWANFVKKATDISAELNRHEIAGENYSTIAQALREHCDANPSLPAHEMAALRKMELECRLEAGESLELAGLFKQAAKQYETASLSKLFSEGENAEVLQKAAVCYEKAKEYVKAADTWDEVQTCHIITKNEKACGEALASEFKNVLAAIEQLKGEMASTEYGRDSYNFQDLADLNLRASWLEKDPAKAAEYANTALKASSEYAYGDRNHTYNYNGGVAASYSRLGNLASDSKVKLEYYSKAVEIALENKFQPKLYEREMAAFEKLSDQMKLGICDAISSCRKADGYADNLRATFTRIAELDALRPAVPRSGAAKGSRGAVEDLYEKQGVRNFGRYEADFLAAQFDKMGKRQGEKPLLLVVYPEGDHSGAFMHYFDDIAKLEKDFDVRLTEAGTAYGAGRRVVDIGSKYGEINTMILGGHGDGQMIDLGKGVVSAEMISAGPDFSRYFADAPSFVTISCLGGIKGGPAEAAHNRYQNATTYGPETIAKMPDISWKISVEGKPAFKFNWGEEKPEGAVFGGRGTETAKPPAASEPKQAKTSSNANAPNFELEIAARLKRQWPEQTEIILKRENRNEILEELATLSPKALEVYMGLAGRVRQIPVVERGKQIMPDPNVPEKVPTVELLSKEGIRQFKLSESYLSTIVGMCNQAIADANANGKPIVLVVPLRGGYFMTKTAQLALSSMQKSGKVKLITYTGSPTDGYTLRKGQVKRQEGHISDVAEEWQKKGGANLVIFEEISSGSSAVRLQQVAAKIASKTPDINFNIFSLATNVEESVRRSTTFGISGPKATEQDCANFKNFVMLFSPKIREMVLSGNYKAFLNDKVAVSGFLDNASGLEHFNNILYLSQFKNGTSKFASDFLQKWVENVNPHDRLAVEQIVNWNNGAIFEAGVVSDFNHLVQSGYVNRSSIEHSKQLSNLSGWSSGNVKLTVGMPNDLFSLDSPAMAYEKEGGRFIKENYDPWRFRYQQEVYGLFDKILDSYKK
ncbi:MAG: hypothetical protein WC861_01920 [Candidatus Micrarchaeia archaeon]